YTDQVRSARFGKDAALYLVCTKDAPRGKVLRLPLANPEFSRASQLVPQSEAALRQVIPTTSLVYVLESDDGPSRLRVFDLKGAAKGEVPLLRVSAVNGANAFLRDDLLFENESYLTPGAWLQYESASGTVTRPALVEPPPANFGDAEVLRVTADSK